jgi:dTDP-4-dehydrorhamnose reductase
VETDPVHALNMYGCSTLLGEQEAQDACPDALIVRISWVYGVHGKNFVKTILQLAANQSDIRVVNDQRGGPTYARHLARMICE